MSTAQAGPLPAPGVIGYGVRSLVDPGSALRIVPRGIPTIAPWLASFALHARRGPYERGARALSALGGRSVAMLDELAADGVPDTGRDTGMLVVAMDPAAVEHAREEMEPLVAAGEPRRARSSTVTRCGRWSRCCRRRSRAGSSSSATARSIRGR